MKTFCIVFIISAWACFLVWIYRHTENKGMKLGIPVLALAALFFCCMGVRIFPAKLLFLPAIFFATMFGTCLFFSIANRKKDLDTRRIIFIAGCVLSITVLMYTDSRITSRNSYPLNPRPERQTIPPEQRDSIGSDFNDTNGKKEDSDLSSLSEPLTQPETSESVTEDDTEKSYAPDSGQNSQGSLMIMPYKLSKDEEKRYTTFPQNPILLLTEPSALRTTKEGIFACCVRDDNGQNIDAVVDFKFLYPEEAEICSVSHILRGDGVYTVIVHPIKAGSACMEISSPNSDISFFVLIKISESEEIEP